MKGFGSRNTNIGLEGVVLRTNLGMFADAEFACEELTLAMFVKNLTPWLFVRRVWALPA